jgi:hypothetical protein
MFFCSSVIFGRAEEVRVGGIFSRFNLAAPSIAVCKKLLLVFFSKYKYNQQIKEGETKKYFCGRRREREKKPKRHKKHFYKAKSKLICDKEEVGNRRKRKPSSHIKAVRTDRVREFPGSCLLFFYVCRSVHVGFGKFFNETY